jgi:hypothetical protein
VTADRAWAKLDLASGRGRTLKHGAEGHPVPLGVRWFPSWPKVKEALYGYAEAKAQSFDAI